MARLHPPDNLEADGRQVVWTWDEKDNEPPRTRRLLVREDESGDLKYSLTKLPPETNLKRLAYIQNQRT